MKRSDREAACNARREVMTKCAEKENAKRKRASSPDLFSLPRIQRLAGVMR
jgi:hypothetical protein